MAVTRISEAKKFNREINLDGKRAFVVGGTGGIGNAIAVRLAAMGADVSFSGRNTPRATRTLFELRSTRPEGVYKYFRFENSEIAVLKRALQDVCQEYETSGLDILFLCAGVGPNTRERTNEKHDYTFAVQVLARCAAVKELLPALRRVEAPRVIMVAVAGLCKDFEFDLDDIELNSEKNRPQYSMQLAMKRDSMILDAFTAEMNRRVPAVAFIHTMPEYVNTKILENSGYTGLVAAVTPWFAKVFARSPKDYAELMCFVAAAEEFGPPPFKFCLGPNLEDVLKLWATKPEKTTPVYLWICKTIKCQPLSDTSTSVGDAPSTLREHWNGSTLPKNDDEVHRLHNELGAGHEKRKASQELTGKKRIDAWKRRQRSLTMAKKGLAKTQKSFDETDWSRQELWNWEDKKRRSLMVEKRELIDVEMKECKFLDIKNQELSNKETKGEEQLDVQNNELLDEGKVAELHLGHVKRVLRDVDEKEQEFFDAEDLER